MSLVSIHFKREKAFAMVASPSGNEVPPHPPWVHAIRQTDRAGDGPPTRPLSTAR